MKFKGVKIVLPAQWEGGARAAFSSSGEFLKSETPSPNPARIPPQTPPAGGKSAEAKRKIISPRKTDFRFAESVLKPNALPEYLEGRIPKEKHPFLFQKKFHPRQIKKARDIFLWGCWRTRQCVGLWFIRPVSARKKFAQSV